MSNTHAPRPAVPVRPGTMSFPREDLWTLASRGTQVLYGKAWRAVSAIGDCEKAGHVGCVVVTVAGIPVPQHVAMSRPVWMRHPVVQTAGAR